jgi:hypothetical protein
VTSQPYSYAFVQLDTETARTYLARMDEAAKLMMNGSDARALCYKDANISPWFLSNLAPIKHLIDAGSKQPFSEEAGFRYAVSEAGVVLNREQEHSNSPYDVRLCVTNSGCYWIGSINRLYVYTGYLDRSYLQRFVTGRLQ